MARMFTLRFCRHHRWCETGAAYPTSVRGLWWYTCCSGRRYHAVITTTATGIFFFSFLSFFFFPFSPCIHQDGLSRRVYQKCCLNFIFLLCILLEDHSHFNICTAEWGERFISLGVLWKFLWGCHFLNYGEKHWFGEFIVWVAEEFIDDSRSLIKVWEWLALTLYSPCNEV